MLPKLKNVYREIYTYLSNGSQGEEVKRLYERLFILNKRIETYQQVIIKPAEKMVEAWNSSDKEDKDEALLFEKYELLFEELQGIMPTTREMLSPDFMTNESCLALHELTQHPSKAREYTDSEVQMNEINKCLSLLSPFLELLQQQYAELKLAIGRIAQAEEGM